MAYEGKKRKENKGGANQVCWKYLLVEDSFLFLICLSFLPSQELQAGSCTNLAVYRSPRQFESTPKATWKAMSRVDSLGEGGSSMFQELPR